MEKKIGKNVSSGARKVENVEKENKITAQSVNESAPKTDKKKSAQASKKSAPAKKTTAKKSVPENSPKEKSVKKAEKKEKAAAQKRLEHAKARAEKKEKKLMHRAELKQKKMEKAAALKQKKIEKKAALKQKKLDKKAALQEKAAQRKQKKLDKIAAFKEKKAQRRAEKEARREMLKHESKAEKGKRREREKKERIALRRQRQEAREKARENRMKAREASRTRRAENKKHKREQKTERKKHAPGFGGWLAAVISLGTVCLVLATVVTAGSVRMSEMDSEMTGGYRSTLFEMVSVSEDMDDNLSKLRVSSGENEQRKLLTQLLVDSALMESALERIPVDAATSTDISAFVNRTGAYSRTLLAQIAEGKPLTQTQKNTVAYLYQINDKLYRELNDLATHMTESEFRAFLNGKEGQVSQKFGEMGQTTLGEPQETVDAPFSGEGNVGENRLNALEEISSARAEELVKSYLNGYHLTEVRYAGETLSNEAECYNFELKDANDNSLYAQITKRGGKLAFFDTYETCTEKNFDLDTCDALAREFLSSIGIDGVEAVWLSDAGMVADITYVAVQNGVRVYPDMIRVRVCESKGRVVGVDAVGYLLNHGTRSLKAGLSAAEARAMLSSVVTPSAEHLALVPVDGKETLAYEFFCNYGEDEYVVYLDANTGEEVQVYVVKSGANGSYLR